MRRGQQSRMRVAGATIAMVALLTTAGCSASDAEDARDSAVAEAKVNACKVEKRTVLTASEAFSAQAQRLPVSVDELKNDTQVTVAGKTVTIASLIKLAPQYWDIASDGKVIPKPDVDLPDGCD